MKLKQKPFTPLAAFILIFSHVLVGCHEPDIQETKKAVAPIELHPGDEKFIAIDTAQSTVQWKGSNTMDSHTGFVSISKGELMVENGQLAGGAVEINMKSIVDDKHQHDNGLIDHLKDADFFDVRKYPTAAVVITKVAPTSREQLIITANLTIKDIMNTISFPIKLEESNGKLTATGNFLIDRTAWGIHYKSGKILGRFADEIILDSIEFNFKIVADKQVLNTP